MPENDDENKVIFTPKTEEEGRIDEFPALNPEDLQVPQLATVPVDSEELEAEEKIMEGVEELTEEDFDKRNYFKVSPTFYIQPIESENEEEQLFKVLNPETQEVETRELTEEEMHEIRVQELKQSRIRFQPTRHPVKTIEKITVVNSLGRKRVEKTKAVATNETINKYDNKYKQKRKRRNKLAKASRKANR